MLKVRSTTKADGIVAYASRVEHWREGPVLWLLCVVDGPSRAHARVLSRGPDGWRHGEASLPRRAIRGDRGALIDAIPTGPASVEDVGDLLGTPPFPGPRPCSGLVRFIATGAVGIPLRSRMPARDAHAAREAAAPAMAHAARSMAGGHPGYARLPLTEVETAPSVPRVRFAGKTDPSAPVHVPDIAPDDPLCVVRLLAPCAERLEPVRATFAESVLHHPHLAPVHWTPVSDAYFSAAGALGHRRRQAASVHPALAPALPHAPEAMDAVDHGLPFESALARHVSAWHAPGTPPLDDARMRALRSLDAALPYHDICASTRLAALLPPSVLPRTPDGWRALLAAALPVTEAVARMGLDTGPALKGLHRHWASSPDPLPKDFKQDLQDAVDMADWCGQFLVGPLLGDVAPGRDASMAIAARLLFGGIPAKAVIGKSLRWHAGIVEFTARLPLASSDATWPVPCAEFRHGGSTLRFLAGQADLLDEGVTMRNCVAGYGRRCHEGRSMVASVSRDDGRRLSTVEFHHRDGRIVVAQHLGPSNASPPTEAVEAVGAFMRAVADGTLTTDPSAWAMRGPGPYGQAALAGMGDVAGRAVVAWAPWLLPGVPRKPDELGASCRRILDGTWEGRDGA